MVEDGDAVFDGMGHRHSVLDGKERGQVRLDIEVQEAVERGRITGASEESVQLVPGFVSFHSSVGLLRENESQLAIIENGFSPIAKQVSLPQQAVQRQSDDTLP